MPEADSGAVAGTVADAPRGNWVDRFAPAGTRPYLRLSRADRPIGTWLLLLPCWWGLALGILQTGRHVWFDLWIVVGCAIGAVLMRGAGCTWNDISDRKIDAQVARTRSRPIPSGQVSVRAAVVWMVAQALLALLILLTFNLPAIVLGIVALVPVAIYPFAKRFTWWPQVFLGLAFNWGALLAYTAHTGALGWPAVVLGSITGTPQRRKTARGSIRHPGSTGTAAANRVRRPGQTPATAMPDATPSPKARPKPRPAPESTGPAPR